MKTPAAALAAESAESTSVQLVIPVRRMNNTCYFITNRTSSNIILGGSRESEGDVFTQNFQVVLRIRSRKEFSWHTTFWYPSQSAWVNEPALKW